MFNHYYTDDFDEERETEILPEEFFILMASIGNLSSRPQITTHLHHDKVLSEKRDIKMRYKIKVV